MPSRFRCGASRWSSAAAGALGIAALMAASFVVVMHSSRSGQPLPAGHAGRVVGARRPTPRPLVAALHSSRPSEFRRTSIRILIAAIAAINDQRITAAIDATVRVRPVAARQRQRDPSASTRYACRLAGLVTVPPASSAAHRRPVSAAAIDPAGLAYVLYAGIAATLPVSPR